MSPFRKGEDKGRPKERVTPWLWQDGYKGKVRMNIVPSKRAAWCAEGGGRALIQRPLGCDRKRDGFFK